MCYLSNNCNKYKYMDQTSKIARMMSYIFEIAVCIWVSIEWVLDSYKVTKNVREGLFRYLFTKIFMTLI